MELKDTIKEMAEKCLPGEEFFIIETKVTGKPNQQKVLIVIDGEKGVSIDDCAAVSRKLDEMLDKENLLSGAYHLEVTSPGADEDIQNPRQYLKNIGRRIEVFNEDNELTIGILESVLKDGIVLITETKKKKIHNKDKKEENRLEIPHSKIKKSNVIISFK